MAGLMFTKIFWKNLIERVISSAAGGALAGLAVDAVIDSKEQLIAMGTAAGTAALFSFLKGLAASQFYDPQSPSLANLSEVYDTPGKHAVDRVRH